MVTNKHVFGFCSVLIRVNLHSGPQVFLSFFSQEDFRKEIIGKQTQIPIKEILRSESKCYKCSFSHVRHVV